MSGSNNMQFIIYKTESADSSEHPSCACGFYYMFRMETPIICAREKPEPNGNQRREKETKILEIWLNFIFYLSGSGMVSTGLSYD